MQYAVLKATDSNHEEILMDLVSSHPLEGPEVCILGTNFQQRLPLMSPLLSLH